MYVHDLVEIHPCIYMYISLHIYDIYINAMTYYFCDMTDFSADINKTSAIFKPVAFISSSITICNAHFEHFYQYPMDKT